ASTGREFYSEPAGASVKVREGGYRDRVNAPGAAEAEGQFLAAMIQRNVAAEIVARVDLARPGNLLFGVEQHLHPLRDPARRARNGEKDGEHDDGEAHRLINEAGVEIDVGIEAAG